MSDVIKLPGETRELSIDLGPNMPTGDTIASITAVEEIGSDALTISNIMHTGAVVSFLVDGGEQGAEYILRIRFVTEGTPPQSLRGEVRLTIRSMPSRYTE